MLKLKPFQFCQQVIPKNISWNWFHVIFLWFFSASHARRNQRYQPTNRERKQFVGHFVKVRKNRQIEKQHFGIFLETQSKIGLPSNLNILMRPRGCTFISNIRDNSLFQQLFFTFFLLFSRIFNTFHFQSWKNETEKRVETPIKRFNLKSNILKSNISQKRQNFWAKCSFHSGNAVYFVYA